MLEQSEGTVSAELYTCGLQEGGRLGVDALTHLFPFSFL